MSVCPPSFAPCLRHGETADKFFFGDTPLAKVGSHGPAYIMSVDNNGVRVEFMGIETRITRGQLTSRHLVTDATEYYKPGMAIDVAIREHEVDKENRTIQIRLSGVMREVQLGLVKNVKSIDLSTKPHELAEVVVCHAKPLHRSPYFLGPSSALSPRITFVPRYLWQFVTMFSWRLRA